jgi:hypothetical protein
VRSSQPIEFIVTSGHLNIEIFSYNIFSTDKLRNDFDAGIETLYIYIYIYIYICVCVLKYVYITIYIPLNRT